jgi:hypothetical protein
MLVISFHVSWIPQTRKYSLVVNLFANELFENIFQRDNTQRCTLEALEELR